MTRRTIALVSVGVLCTAGVVGWRYAARPTPAEAEAQPAPVPVVTARVSVSDMPIVKVGLGTVNVYNTVAVHTQVTGTIQQIGFVEGQTVHPGSLIAQLDPRPYQAALQQAEATLAKDEAHLQNAQANLDRYVPLLKPGFSTGQQVDDQVASVAEVRAAISSDEALIANAQTQLSYTTIVSPIDGVTGIRRVDIGNIVQPGTGTVIVTITQLQPISVVFTLPQKDLPDVQAAMQKRPLKTVAYPQDSSKPLGEGSLLLINNQISQASGTVDLKATFPNADNTLWPGEFVEVRLITGIQHDAVSVPLSALQQGDAGERVFVVAKDNSVTLRPVDVVETLDGRALVDDGLKPDDTVVVAGQYRLEDGTRIAAVAPNNPHVQNQTPMTQGMLQ